MKRIACLTFVLIVAGHMGFPLAVLGEEKPAVQKIQLRSQPWVVSEDEVSEKFGLVGGTIPQQYIDNDFEELGETVIDRATGLMWQKAVSEAAMEYEDALKYVQELNKQTFADYNDWRLPTMPELLSLLELSMKEETNWLFIDPIFPPPPAGHSGHYACWSADHRPSREDTEWSVCFAHGRVRKPHRPLNFVRAVRSVQ